MENNNANQQQPGAEPQAVTGKFWCACCDYELDAQHVCWNEDWDGLGNKCPMYGRPQA